MAPPNGSRVRKGSSVSRGNRHGLPINAEGEKAADQVTHLSKMTSKQQQQLFEHVTNQKINCQGFLENKEKNRAPVPLHEKKRVRLTQVAEGDVEYAPATYATCERDEYIIWQAPTKDNYLNLWRNVWQDNVKIMVSVSDKFSDSDTALCYPYWPTKEGTSMEIQNGRFSIKNTKKTDQKGFFVYDLTVMSTDVVEAAGKEVKEKSTDTDEQTDEGDTKKPRQITLLHIENWSSDSWPDIEVIANFVSTLSKRETQVVRKSIDTFVPPVLIQGHEGIGRTAVVWVSTILMKDIEKRDNFDVEDLIKKFSKIRPSAFSNRLHYFVQFAVAFRCAGLSTWLNSEDSKSRVKEIKDAYLSSTK